MSWLSRLFGKARLERDLDRELQFHIDSHAADLMRAGVPAEEARRRARIELGGVEQVKEEARDARGTSYVEEWWSDTQFALRMLARTPAFTATAILTLAVGIGATTAVWSIMDALMLRSLPVERPEELHAVRRDGLQDGNFLISHATMQRMRANLPDTTQLAGMGSISRMYVTIGDVPEAAETQAVSGTFFPLLGVGASAGRLLGPSDDVTLGGHPVAVIGDRFWRSRFGASDSVIGQPIRLNGYPMTVVGVAPAGFTGVTVGQDVDVWIPLAMQHEVRYKPNASSNNSDTEQPWIPQPGVSWLTLITRAPAGETGAWQARLDAPFRAVLNDELAQLDSADRAYGLREHVALDPLGRGFSGLRQAYKDPLRILMASVAFVLLIACSNMAGLLLSRGSARANEITLRISLGARRGRLVRQLLTESMTLGVLGGIAGLVVARFGASALLRLATSNPRGIPLDVSLDARLLGFAFALAIVTGLLFGLAPALRLTRVDLHDVLKAGNRVVAARGAHRLPFGRALVVSQIGLSLLLVTSALLFLKTFQNFISIDPGYDRDQVLAARIDVRAAGYQYADLPALHERLLEAVRAVPGVRSASLSMYVIAGGARRSSGFEIPGRELPPGGNIGQENFVTPGFFGTVGMELRAGRDFTAADRDSAPQVAIINEAAAQYFFGTLDVIGARFGYGSPPDVEVIGLVKDARVNTIKEAPPRMIYKPIAQAPQEYVSSLEARVSGASETVVTGIREAIGSVNRSLPVRDVLTLGTLIDRGLIRERLLARLAAVLGLIALMLAGIGLYGIMAYSVSRRTNEMGVRLALGASPPAVAGIVLRDSLVTILAGLALGALLWFPLLGLTRRLVYGLSPHDPATLIAATILLFLVSVVAGLLPAWRAARIDPARAIRGD